MECDISKTGVSFASFALHLHILGGVWFKRLLPCSSPHVSCLLCLSLVWLVVVSRPWETIHQSIGIIPCVGWKLCNIMSINDYKCVSKPPMVYHVYHVFQLIESSIVEVTLVSLGWSLPSCGLRGRRPTWGKPSALSNHGGFRHQSWGVNQHAWLFHRFNSFHIVSHVSLFPATHLPFAN